MVKNLPKTCKHLQSGEISQNLFTLLSPTLLTWCLPIELWLRANQNVYIVFAWPWFDGVNRMLYSPTVLFTFILSKQLFPIFAGCCCCESRWKLFSSRCCSSGCPLQRCKFFFSLFSGCYLNSFNDVSSRLWPSLLFCHVQSGLHVKSDCI